MKGEGMGVFQALPSGFLSIWRPAPPLANRAFNATLG
jgi:hypothetical protein